MSKSSKDGQHQAIVFVLKKLRRMTLEGFRFGQEYYELEFYKMDSKKAIKSSVAEHELDALRYLNQKGVIVFDEAYEPDESVVSDLNEEKYQQELARFGLIDNGTVIAESPTTIKKTSKRAVFNSSTGEVTFKGKRLILAHSTKQYYVARACIQQWGKQVPELTIIDELETNSFDAGDRVVRDCVPRLNAKFKEAFQVENAFHYSGGHVFIDPMQFETV